MCRTWPKDEEGRYAIAFVGAGPGDPELITLKGRRLLEEADLVVYTGSLVPKDLISGLPAQVVDSAPLTLEEIMALLKRGYDSRKRVVRLHTGDPALYSTIGEQIARLAEDEIPYFVVPGVTAGFAAAASLGIELTIPGQTQTVIISRISGRTPVPPKEDMERLAAVQASLVLYLSVHKIEEVVEKLAKGGYHGNTPVAVVEKATWPEQKVIMGTLETITRKVEAAGIKRTAVILVGEAVGDPDKSRQRSLLYHPSFSHAARPHAKEITGGPGGPPVDLTFFDRLYVVFLNKRGNKLGRKIQKGIQHPHVELVTFKAFKELHRSGALWNKGVGLIFIMASGIVIRSIAPCIKSKKEDPAVVVLDESGMNAISLLSGHLGRANELCRVTASLTGARPVITTASDVLGLAPIDLWAEAHDLEPVSKDGLKRAASLLVSKKELKVYTEFQVHSLPPGVVQTTTLDEADLVVSLKKRGNASPGAVHFVPKIVSIGIGCHSHISAEQLFATLMKFLAGHDLHEASVKCLASIDRRRDTPALFEIAKRLGIPLRFFSREELSRLEVQTPSEMVESSIGLKGVAEPAALLAAGSTASLIIPKRKYGHMTLAAAMDRFSLTSRTE